jgi:hypothetical protein
MSKPAANFIHALVAVLVGNAAYFLLGRYLPPKARHVPFQIDLGLVVDFWLCLVAFGHDQDGSWLEARFQSAKWVGLLVFLSRHVFSEAGCLDFGQKCVRLSSTLGYFRNLRNRAGGS